MHPNKLSRREHEDRDGMADKGIFGGRKRHSLVIHSSGELLIERTPSGPSGAKTLLANAIRETDSGDESLSVHPVTLPIACPHCTESFDLSSEDIDRIKEVLFSHLESGASSVNQSRRPSDTISVSMDGPTPSETVKPEDIPVVPDVVEPSPESPGIDHVERRQKKHRRHHKRRRRHRKRERDPITLKPMPLLSNGKVK